MTPADKALALLRDHRRIPEAEFTHRRKLIVAEADRATTIGRAREIYKRHLCGGVHPHVAHMADNGRYDGEDAMLAILEAMETPR